MSVDPAEHLTFARGIARGVRADYRFTAASQEEAELEAVAYLVLCEYAARFDPLRAWWATAEAAITDACRAWKRGTPFPRVTGPVRFAGRDRLELVRAAAEVVAKRRRFPPGSVERAALVCVAIQAALDCVAAFDAVKAFRGWCSVEIRSRCRREALRLRNGGLFHTTRDKAARGVTVGALPPASSESGDYSACETAVVEDRRRAVPAEPDLDGPDLPDPADFPAARPPRTTAAAPVPTADTSSWKRFVRKLFGR